MALPPAVNKGFFFFTTSATPVITCLVDISHSSRCEGAWRLLPQGRGEGLVEGKVGQVHDERFYFGW